MKPSTRRLFVLVAAASLSVSSMSLRHASADEPTAAPTTAAPSTVPSAAPSTAPTTGPSARMKELNGKFRDLRIAINSEVSDPEAFTDAKLRPAIAAKLKPLYAKQDELAKEIIAEQPDAATELADLHEESIGTLAALDDKDALAQLNTMAANADSTKATKGKAMLLDVRWTQLAGEDTAGQTKLLDDAEPLVKAHPESEDVTATLAGWAEGTTTPEVADRALALAGSMHNDATALVDQAKQIIGSVRKMKELEGKPLVVSGTTPDGKTFSTDQYKGKVVLVDFWATWCGPCVASLPKVKQTYQQYHSEGLEIVGVSNDYKPEKLTTFIQEQNMPWVQLYDATAASHKQWSSVTAGYGIIAIPHMFLIGRDGKLISSNARSTFPKLIDAAVKTQG